MVFILSEIPRFPLSLWERGGVRASMGSDYRDSAGKVSLLERCRRMRHEPSEAELRLWSRLRNRQVGGVKFRRQHQFGPYILDFFCPELNLAIEVDGGQHTIPRQVARDEARSLYLAARNIRVLRFSCEEVLQETDAVVERILVEADGPHPDPLPEGEGEMGALPEDEGIGIPLHGDGGRVPARAS